MMEREQLVSLVQGLQRGDNDAATALYDAFYNDIYYFIQKTVNDPELAADLTQDTFIEILQTVGSLKEPAAFVSWSRQIAYHRCTAHFRKRRELLADEDADGHSVFDTIEEERTEFIPDEALDRAELRKTIHGMIDSLPEAQRAAIMMRYFDELSVKEIADIQGVSEGTVKSRLNYGRKVIKQSVEDYEKKNNIKLRCAGVVPLLLWLFREYRKANGLALTAKSAATAATATTAAATGAGASSGASAAAVKAGTAAGKYLAAKIVAGVTAAALVTGGAVAVLSQPEGESPKQTQSTSAPTQPQPPTTESEPQLFFWWGYGTDATKLHTRRFEMTVDEMSDTRIRGHLLVSYLYETSHDTEFQGTGTRTDDGKIRYDITYEVPAVMGTIPTYEYSQMTMVYDPETETITFDDEYLVVLNRAVTRPTVQVIARNETWSGEGENVLCWPNPDGHFCELRINTMTDTEIRGTIEVYENGTLEHSTKFTGRGYDDGVMISYEVVLEDPHYAYDMWDSVEEYLWMYYHWGTDMISMNSYYEFQLSRDSAE